MVVKQVDAPAKDDEKGENEGNEESQFGHVKEGAEKKAQDALEATKKKAKELEDKLKAIALSNRGTEKSEDKLKDKKEGINGLLNFFSSSVLYAIMIFVVIVKLGQGLASDENVSQAVVTWVILGSALILLGKVLRDKAAGTAQGITNAQMEALNQSKMGTKNE